MSRRAAAADRGSATLWLLAVGLVLVAAGLAGAAVGAARVGHQRARVAADLGALAGAARVPDGPAAACTRAAELVTANGGRLVDCEVDGLDIQIRVELTVTPLPRLNRVATAAARAGPVRADWNQQLLSGGAPVLQGRRSRVVDRDSSGFRCTA